MLVQSTQKEARPWALRPDRQGEQYPCMAVKMFASVGGSSGRLQETWHRPDQIASLGTVNASAPRAGRYEWWYFDANLGNGATVVVVFLHKRNVSHNGPLAPRITIELNLPDGRTFQSFSRNTPALFNASRSGCDVRIGNQPLRRHLNAPNKGTIEAAIGRHRIGGERSAPGVTQSGHSYFGAEGPRKTLRLASLGAKGRAKSDTVGINEHSAIGSRISRSKLAGDTSQCRGIMHNWTGARASGRVPTRSSHLHPAIAA